MNIKEKIDKVYHCTLEQTGTKEVAELSIVIEKFKRFCVLIVIDLWHETIEHLCALAAHAFNLLRADPKRRIPFYTDE